MFKAEDLERVIKDTIMLKLREESSEEKMLDPRAVEGDCKAYRIINTVIVRGLLIRCSFVGAVQAMNVAVASGPRRFQTYRVPRNQSCDYKIWEAAQATSAAPTLFKRIEIGSPGMQEEFVDAGVGCNNPVKQIEEKAELNFGPDRNVACIVSIGTGRASVI